MLQKLAENTAMTQNIQNVHEFVYILNIVHSAVHKNCNKKQMPPSHTKSHAHLSNRRKETQYASFMGSWWLLQWLVGTSALISQRISRKSLELALNTGLKSVLERFGELLAGY